ncbi:MAG TPA: hypothetical protein VK846_17680, partial [Candidatus Limnocylindria bacterium]|nr:hypothetical protein [Candidatus Limnocylindria bacterium]
MSGKFAGKVPTVVAAAPVVTRDWKNEPTINGVATDAANTLFEFNVSRAINAALAQGSEKPIVFTRT